MRIVCLANSWKEGGRCVAGIDVESGRWVRPVSTTSHGQLSLAEATLRDSGQVREVRALDVVDLGELIRRPEVGQPENFALGSRGMALVSTVEPDFLERFVDRRNFLLHGTSASVATEHASLVQSSLTLVRVENPQFRVNPRNERQLRAQFRFAGVEYDLPVTDASSWVDFAKIDPRRFSIGPWYFTISLGVPFHGWMYKLVACGIPHQPIPTVGWDWDEPPF